MALQVCSGAMLQCSFGIAPSTLNVLPTHQTFVENMPAVNIMDHIPMVNIMPFGMCQSLANPAVATATTAALGVLTPMPCVPVIPAPWTPGAPTVMIGNMPALDDTSMCTCTWAGIIQITFPGQTTVQIP
jgi:hypothetical protein